MDDRDSRLDLAQGVLGRCALVGIAFILVWAAAALWARPLIDRQAGLFGVTPHECALVMYGGLGFAKVLVLVLFVFPWLALRWTPRRRG
ncbi:MAG: hypothetical protein KGL53_01270 [Elusimicrobia bacterium]|nr:hypothetical protein [Elusimicrobiota bacterium]